MIEDADDDEIRAGGLRSGPRDLAEGFVQRLTASEPLARSGERLHDRLRHIGTRVQLAQPQVSE